MPKSPAPARHLVSVNQAAEYAAVNPKTIRRRISDGSLTGFRIGSKSIRVDLHELDAFMQPIPTACQRPRVDG